MQALDYRRSLIGQIDSLLAGTEHNIRAVAPRCVVVAGNASLELDTNEKRDAFELFRRNSGRRCDYIRRTLQEAGCLGTSLQPYASDAEGGLTFRSAQTLCAKRTKLVHEGSVSTELMVALISAGVAVASAAFTIWGQLRTAKLAADLQHTERVHERRYEAERIVSRFREPLAQAAFERRGSPLRTSSWQGLIAVYYNNGTQRDRAYVLGSTTYSSPNTSGGRRSFGGKCSFSTWETSTAREH